MRSWFFPPATPRPPVPLRALESTPDQVVASGASLGSWGGVDPVDGDTGWRPAGLQGRQVPPWTQEKARIYSVASYRTNPMARAIIDTYVAFCVGDRGVSYQATNPLVEDVVRRFWYDPRNRLHGIQELFLRDQLLMGETLLEMMVGPMSGSTRFSPIDPSIISEVSLTDGNPLWPGKVHFRRAEEDQSLTIAAVNDNTNLREGECMFWTPFKALLTDRRGMPFLEGVLDWLDSYDNVLSNLMDRTALSRYLVWDVTVQGEQSDVDNFVKSRGGVHVPKSGSVEVHNQAVTWEPKTAASGAYEDTKAAQSVLTSIASGSGLAKTWLAEPDGANRAVSHTMAEPVRRRVASVQNQWLEYQTELVRYAVDKAVDARILPSTVDSADPRTGATIQIPASESVLVTGPEIAAADAQITAEVLLNLSTGLQQLVGIGALTKEAASLAARKAWEDYMGVPYRAELDKPDANPDDVATHVDDNQQQEGGLLQAV